MTRTRVALTVLLGALTGTRGPADEPRWTRAEVAKRGKPAVAFVLAKVATPARPGRPAGTAQGTAFCVHPSGLFVTSAHVVRGATEIEIVVNPSLTGEKVLKGEIVRTHEGDDLALLRADTKDAVPALALGDDTKLEELADVVALGYPFGSALTFGTKDYPSVTTTGGAVSSLRRKAGELELIQLDVDLNPGNSGGPVLDMSARVVGVVLGGIRGTQVNFAVPVRRVAAFLAKPEFAFTPPALRLSDRGRSVAVEARLVALLPGPADAEVELEVRRGRAAVKRHPMKPEKGLYKADVVILPEAKADAKCVVEVSFADGSLTAQVADRLVKVGAATHSLSEFRTISPAANQAVLWSGARLEGKVAGLDAVPVTLGGRAVAIDLSVAREITSQARGDEPVATLAVVARRGGREVGRITRPVILDDAGKVFLADLHAFATNPGPWPLGVGTTGSPDRTPIVVNGKPYPKGLGLHANNPPATASYRVNKTAAVFRASVAYDDGNDGKVTGPTHFEVYGDGRQLWKSKAITTRHQTGECLVDVSGVDVLELRVSVSGGGWGVHAVWLDPHLIGADEAAIRKAGSKD